MEIKGSFAIKSLTELRDMYKDLHKSAMTLIDKAKQENRNLTEEELRSYDSFNSQLDELNIEIDKANKLEEKRKQDAMAYIHTQSRDKERRELSQFSLQKYIRDIMHGGPQGFEREMAEEAVSEAREAKVSLQGFGVPRKVFYRDVNISATSGGDTIATEVQGYVDYLWDYLVFDKLGVDKWTDLKGNINVPKVTTQATATFKSTVNETATEVSPVYDYIALTPNVLAATIDLDKQLILQSSVAVEQKLKEMLVKAVAIKYEYQAINDVSTNWVGLLTACTSTAAIGTSGGAATWALVTYLEGLVEQSNALSGSLAYLASGKGKSKLKAVSADTGSGRFLCETVWDFAAKQSIATCNGYPLYVTPALLNNVTKGSNTACTNVVFGNWSDCIVATWGPAYDLIVNPYTRSKDGLVELTIHSFCDFAVKQANSFARITDLLTE